jgi:hypothetical protein
VPLGQHRHGHGAPGIEAKKVDFRSTPGNPAEYQCAKRANQENHYRGSNDRREVTRQRSHDSWCKVQRHC